LGPLKWVPSPLGYAAGYEPTGRHPFGAVFKVVVWEPDERSDQISFKLLFPLVYLHSRHWAHLHPL
jgi:hypothetical protein